MKKLLAALLLLPALGWAGYQPVTGSTITAVNPVGGALTVVTSTTGVNASTIAVTNAGGVALKVDGSAVTQPVSGTFFQTTQPVSVATPYQVSLSTSGVSSSTAAVVNAVGTKLLVTPDSVALPANQSVNLSQVAGTTPDTNSGTKSAGTVRVVIATDQPALTNKILVTPDSVALPANQSVNVSQVGATTVDTNSGTKSAGTQRFVIATDQPQLTNALKVDGSAVTQPISGTVQPGNTPNTTAWLVNVATIGVIGIDGVSRGAGYASQSSSVPVAAGGMAASGQAATGNPLFGGVLASSNTSVPQTDKTNVGVVSPIRGTLGGNVVSTMDCPPEQIGFSTITLSATTTETVFVSSGATGIFNDIINLVLINSDATNGTIATIKAAGVRSDNNINLEFYVPSKDTRGFAPPHVWAQPVAASNWTLKSGTSVSDLRGYIEYCKRK